MTVRRKYWAGFVDGKIDIREIDNGFGGWGECRFYAPAVFASRSEARKHYQDVRRVRIVEDGGRK